MATKTRKKIQEEKIKKNYFEYWRLQNNPDYVLFYKRVFKKLKAGNEAFRQTLDELTEDQVKRFQIGGSGLITLVNPFKKIDWTHFHESLKKSDIKDDMPILQMAVAQARDSYKAVYETPGAFEKDEEYLFEGPLIDVTINLNFDKKEIIEEVSSIIDSWREIKRIKPFKRDSINKFHLYAQAWDLRKGPERKTFPQIATIMKTNTSTAKQRFYKAFELIYGIPYDPDVFKEARNTVHKESLKRTCDQCKEKETCTVLCPDVISFAMQDWREKNYREVQPHEKDIKTRAHLGLEK